MNYICKENCQYLRRIWTKGMILVFDEKPVFCKECPTDGICKKCGGSGRIDPPRYFEPQEKKDEAAEREAAEREADAVNEIRNEITALGKSFDRRWGLARLQKELIIAKKSTGA